MSVQEQEEYYEMVSVSTSAISDLSGVSNNHHVHIYII